MVNSITHPPLYSLHHVHHSRPYKGNPYLPGRGAFVQCVQLWYKDNVALTGHPPALLCISPKSLSFSTLFFLLFLYAWFQELPPQGR